MELVVKNKMKYVNTDFFLLTFGAFFSIPSYGEIFLGYIGPVILENASTQTIPLLTFIIWCLVSLGGVFGLIKILIKYYKMRGIIEDNHIRNIVIGMVLGTIIGLELDKMIFG